MYNSNTDSLGLILGVEFFFSEGHCSGALCNNNSGYIAQMTGCQDERMTGRQDNRMTGLLDDWMTKLPDDQMIR